MGQKFPSQGIDPSTIKLNRTVSSHSIITHLPASRVDPKL